MYSATVIGATKERHMGTLKKKKVQPSYWRGAGFQAGKAEPWAERSGRGNK